MKFSIIMPSYLGEYKRAAKDRDTKIVRAIESVLKQSHEDWELIIISDGCEKTVEIVKPFFYKHLPKIRLLQIEKQKVWSGAVRNAGIFKATGDVICYLDIDDYFGDDHLKILNDNFGDSDWIWFDYLSYNIAKKCFDTYESDIFKQGRCGTSSVAHRRSMNIYWRNNTYLHDWVLINQLRSKSRKFHKIPTSQYCVCHVPLILDV